jgi:hypothetical protein
MSHSPALISLLFDIRQHAAFQELLRAVEAPSLPRFKKNTALDMMGAQTVFASGRLDQHEKWLTVLSGEPVNLTNQQE